MKGFQFTQIRRVLLAVMAVAVVFISLPMLPVMAAAARDFSETRVDDFSSTQKIAPSQAAPRTFDRRNPVPTTGQESFPGDRSRNKATEDCTPGDLGTAIKETGKQATRALGDRLNGNDSASLQDVTRPLEGCL